ncbi:hypothetical protein [Clostridium sp.]|uniref:hypothetical protein n=1 Tax=Clostridium sp. TaxID=1506 RepID=UPI002FC748B8
MDLNDIKSKFKVTMDYCIKCMVHCSAYNDKVSSQSLEYKIDKDKNPNRGKCLCCKAKLWQRISA